MIQKNQMQFAALACALLLSGTAHSESNFLRTVKENKKGAGVIAGTLLFAALGFYEYRTGVVTKKAKDLYSKWKKGTIEEIKSLHEIYYVITDNNLNCVDKGTENAKCAFVCYTEDEVKTKQKQNSKLTCQSLNGYYYILLEQDGNASALQMKRYAQTISRSFLIEESKNIETQSKDTEKQIENENVENLIQKAYHLSSKNLAKLEGDEQEEFDGFVSIIKNNENPMIKVIHGAYKNIETLKGELKSTVPSSEFNTKTAELEEVKSELQRIKSELTEKTKEIGQLKLVQQNNQNNQQQPQLQNNINNN